MHNAIVTESNGPSRARSSARATRAAARVRPDPTRKQKKISLPWTVTLRSRTPTRRPQERGRSDRGGTA